MSINLEDKKWKLPKFPLPMDFPYWDTTMTTSICNHFQKAKEDDAIKWFDECKTKSLEELAVTTPNPWL